MRDEQEIPAHRLHPGAGISLVQFEKINRAIEIAMPGLRDHCLILVNLDKGAGAQDGIHEGVLQADITVQRFSNVEILDQRDRHFTPRLNHSWQ